MDSYINSYKELLLSDKRKFLFEEIKDMLDFLEHLCKTKKIKIECLKSSKYINNVNLLNEEDFCELMFIYVTYIKEDLALLLEKSTSI